MCKNVLVWVVALLAGAAGGYWLLREDLEHAWQEPATTGTQLPSAPNNDDSALGEPPSDAVIVDDGSIRSEAPTSGAGAPLSLSPTVGQRDRCIGFVAQGFRKEYKSFLSRTKLSELQQDILMMLCGERSILLNERLEGIKNGRFKTTEEADSFFKRENIRIEGAMRDLLVDEYEMFWAETEKIPIRRQVDIPPFLRS